MNKILLGLAIAFQFLVLTWMVAGREHLLATGEVVWLRTAPVDPQDMFRGDYVTLNYEIANVPQNLWSVEAAKAHVVDELDLPVYVSLAKDEDGHAKATALDVKKPANGLFVKGRMGRNGQIAYGIDAYFVQQGEGHVLEARAPAGLRKGLILPREMEVALGKDGTAALKGGYRWRGIGACVEAIKGGAAGDVQIWFHNATDKPVTLILPADASTLEVEGMQYDYDFRRPQGWKPATPTAADVVVIPPHQEAGRQVSLGTAWVAKRKYGGSQEEGFHPIHTFENLHVSALTYKPPKPEQIAHLGLTPPPETEPIPLGRWIQLFPKDGK